MRRNEYEYFKMVISVYLFIVKFVIISALINPTVKSLIPLIVCSTGVIVGTVVIKND